MRAQGAAGVTQLRLRYRPIQVNSRTREACQLNFSIYQYRSKCSLFKPSIQALNRLLAGPAP
jgi:hypothetical protein